MDASRQQEHPDSARTIESNSAALVYHDSGSSVGRQDLIDLWMNRELIWTFAVRDLKTRYRQSFIGFFWAVIQPLVTMLLYATLFKLLGRSPVSGRLEYSLLCGLIPWQVFSGTVTRCTTCLVANRPLITKVYFPRLVLPVAMMLIGIVDFGIALSVLCGIMLIGGALPSWHILFLPLIVVWILTFVFAAGLWLSALNALWRDVQQAVPVVLQIGMFCSPVVYEMREIIPVDYQWWYSLNPLVGIIESFRWSVLATAGPRLDTSLLAALATLVMLCTGVIFFRRIERHIEDRI